MLNQTRITVSEASKLLNTPVQAIRIALQRKLVPYGYAVNVTGKKFAYYIYRERIEAYLKGLLNA